MKKALLNLQLFADEAADTTTAPEVATEQENTKEVKGWSKKESKIYW